MKKTVITSIFILLSLFVFSQKPSYKKEALKPGANYYEIVKKSREKIARTKYLKSGSRATQKMEKQFERWAFFWKDRVYADGSFPLANLGYINAGIISDNGKIDTRVKRGTLEEESWENIGAQTLPDANGYGNYPQMGRLDAFLYFPDSPGIYFVGAPTGGAWKTTDDGATWTPVLDNVAGIGVTDIASASTTYSNNTVIYLSSGDFDGESFNSIGVLKSTDGGNTFQSTNLRFSLSDGNLTSNLVVINDLTVVVGTIYNIYKTIDGGVNWFSVLSENEWKGFGRFVREGDNIYCSTDNGDVYHSSDNGENWIKIKTGEGSYNDLAMAIDDDGKINILDSLGQVSRYDNSWTKIGGKAPNFDTQGGYNQALVIENKMIIAAGVDGFHTVNSGTNWYKSLNGYWYSNFDDGKYIHPDFHKIGKLDNKPDTYKYWVCNDGGLSFIEYPEAGKTTKPTIIYKSERCIVTQLYSVAITPDAGLDNILQGNQDNDGFSKEQHNGASQWIAVMAGDGTCTAIDYTDTGIRYLGGTEGVLSITKKGFSNNPYGSFYVEIPDASFLWPLEMSTTDHYKLYAGGGDDVYLVNINSADTVTPLNANTGEVSFISTHGNGIFAVGNNKVRKSLDGGETWTTVKNPSSNRTASINSIDFSQNNTNIVYASTKGYISGQKVFKSIDGGINWINISAGLPNILVNEVLLYQNKNSEILYLATELGVYVKKEDDNWKKLSDSSLPNVIVNDIDINYFENVLVAATYGRGLWKIDIAVPTGNKEIKTANKYTPKIYPNPVSNKLNIELPSFTSGKQLRYIIYNVVGGLEMDGFLTQSKNSVNISALAKGNYMFKIIDEDNKYKAQLIMKQ